MYYAPLPQRGLIKLSGDDRIEFLQGLISNDANLLREGKAIYAALLSPQGKFLHDFFIIPTSDSLLIDCEAARADDLLKRLSMYRLRSKIALEKVAGQGVVAVWGVQNVFPPANVLHINDPRLPELGMRLIGDISAIETWCKEQQFAPASYEHVRLELGVPDGSRDMIEGRSILLEFGFEQLHGVDFHKGCYVGQEVTARSKHRAELKKGLYQIRSELPLPAPGTAITQGGIAAGEICSSEGTLGLAILRSEAVEKGGLLAGDIAIAAARPYWFSAD